MQGHSSRQCFLVPVFYTTTTQAACQQRTSSQPRAATSPAHEIPTTLWLPNYTGRIVCSLTTAIHLACKFPFPSCHVSSLVQRPVYRTLVCQLFLRSSAHSESAASLGPRAISEPPNLTLLQWSWAPSGAGTRAEPPHAATFCSVKPGFDANVDQVQKFDNESTIGLVSDIS